MKNRDVNLLYLSGKVHKMPELKKTDAAVPVAKVVVRNTREDSTHYFTVVGYGANSKKIMKFVKGDKIALSGHLQQDKWYSKKFESHISKTVIILDKLEDAISMQN